jgi:hypothetical protein
VKKTNCLIDRITICLGVASFAIFTGCAGHVNRGYVGYDRYDRYDGYVRYGYFGSYDDEGPAPDRYLFGGGYERGSDVQADSRRGLGSLGSVH